MEKIMGSEILDFAENIHNLDHTLIFEKSVYVVFRNHKKVIKAIFENANDAKNGYEKIRKFSHSNEKFLWFEELHGMKDLVFIN